MSDSGLVTDIVVALFMLFGLGTLSLFVGFIGLVLVLTKSPIKIFVGIGVLIVAAFIGLIALMGFISTFTDDDSVKGDRDVELTSMLYYDREVTVYNPYSKAHMGHTSYLYYLDNGTEIGLTKKQHEYVQGYSSDSEFRIIYDTTVSLLREYDFEAGLFGEADTRGTPLFEAGFVEIIE